MHPCDLQPFQPPPAIYTYYAISSLIVVILVTTLLWNPFVQLIAELNTIVSKVLIYTNKELLGNTNLFGLYQLGIFFNSKSGLIIICTISLIFLLYWASADFLIFAGCYIYSLPDFKYLQFLKNLALNIIDLLLNFTRKKRYIIIPNGLEFEQSMGAHHHEAM